MTDDIFKVHDAKNGASNSSTSGPRSETGSLMFYYKEVEQRETNTLADRVNAIRDFASFLVKNKVSKQALTGMEFPLIGKQKLSGQTVELLGELGYAREVRPNPYYQSAVTGIYTRPEPAFVSVLFEDISPVEKPGPFYLFYMTAEQGELDSLVHDFQLVVPGVVPTDRLAELTYAEDRKELKKAGGVFRSLFRKKAEPVEEDPLTPRDAAQLRLIRRGFYEGPHAILKAFVLPEDYNESKRK